MTIHHQNSDSRVWLITGCSKGLGRAFAKAVLEKGERAAITTRRVESIKHFQKDYPDTALALALDVTNKDEVQQAVEETIRRFGHIDVLVNNAGFGMVGAIEEVSDEDTRRVYDTNVFGVLNVIRAVLPHMRSRRNGHIINISSIGGLVSNPGSGIYCSTKFAVEGITESIAQELRQLGIKVTAIEPGPFRTDFAGDGLPYAQPIDDYADTPVGHWRERIPVMNGKQPGDPEKAAAVLLKLVENDNPPLHLVLGNSAMDRIREKIAALNRELDAWEAVGRSVDFEGDSVDLR
jgi:NAD(P)-dependent dehydrogenase (short-subunit alcohol dehydrogenase family)